MPAADRGRGVESWKTLLGSALLLALSRHDVPQREFETPPATTTSPHVPEGSAAHASLAPAPPEDVLWAGCTEVRLSAAGKAEECTLYSDDTVEKATLRVWLPSRVQEPAVQLDGKAAASVDTAEVDGGTSLLVQPGHGGRLTVTGKLGGARIELLSLDVDFRPRPDGELRGRLELAEGDREAQHVLAKELRARLEGEVPPPLRLQLTRYLQFVHFDLGEHREAVEHARESVHLAKEQGKPLTECDSVWSAVFMLGEVLGDADAAVELLRDACHHRGSIPSVDMMGSYYEGILELSQGHFTSARRLLQRSAQISRRLRWPRWEIFALGPLVDTLANQGRFEWARRIHERAHELDAIERSSGLLDRCESRFRYLHERGTLARREADLIGGDPHAAELAWSEARAHLDDRTRCPDHPSLRAEMARVELESARLAVESGELDRAERLLDAVSRESLTPITDFLRNLVRAELELARGDPRVAARILEDIAADRARGRLAAAIEPEESWRFHVVWARVHHARGNFSAALESLAQAQETLDADRRSLGAETDRHAAMRRRSSQLLVRLLLGRRLERSALCAARVARARSFASLAPISEHTRDEVLAMEHARLALFEGYAWYDPRDIPLDERLKLEAKQRSVELSHAPPALVECDQLPVARPGEASLLYFHDGHGYLGFGWSFEGDVIVRRLAQWAPGWPPDSLGDVLISPFARVLEGATTLRVLAPASMHELSFADLPWRGRPLGDRLAVAHALDLPSVPLVDRREQAAALVFSDPEKLLLSHYDVLSRRFDAWRTQLETTGHRVAYVLPPAASSPSVSVQEILRGTAGVDLAVLYGFGAVQASYYDLLPTQAALREPDQDGFGVGADVLSRSDILFEAGAVPRHVILAHCDSATVDPYGVSGAIGLAQSYVQAGSEWAVGAVGDVRPESMEVIVDTLLEALPRGASPSDVAMALQLAKRRLRDQGLPDTDHLRLWVL